MDPSLELQQLASQALQYQATAHSQPFPQHSQSPISFGSDGKQDGSNSSSAEVYPCPFPSCNRHYKRKDLLKRHLTSLLASPDENHQDAAKWAEIKEAGTMTIHTRPRNLTEDQKKFRRKESNLRHRVKYAQELKEKRNRKRRVEKLLEGKQVGVQTPDWDAEAREQAEMAANAAAALNAVAQMQMDGAPEFGKLITEPPPQPQPQPRGRRKGKKQ